VLLVFAVSLLVGALFSWFFLYGRTSVGASGAVLGLAGFLTVLTYRKKDHFPRGYAKGWLLNLFSIAVFGILLIQVVDNAAHLGGTLAGAGLGLYYCRNTKDFSLIDTAAPEMIKYLWPLAGLFLIVASLLTCLKLLQ
jgi:membrane associated rhomboid family serine protease